MALFGLSFLGFLPFVVVALAAYVLSVLGPMPGFLGVRVGLPPQPQTHPPICATRTHTKPATPTHQTTGHPTRPDPQARFDCGAEAGTAQGTREHARRGHTPGRPGPTPLTPPTMAPSRLLLAAAAAALAALAPSANAELQACLEALGQLSTAPYNASLPFLNGVTGAWVYACMDVTGWMPAAGGPLSPPVLSQPEINSLAHRTKLQHKQGM